MYLLDTDTVSNYLDRSRRNVTLRDRLLTQPAERLWISVVTVEEILRGVLDAIREAQKRKRPVTAAYAFLALALEDLRQFQVLPYTEDADRLFQAIPPAVKRVGTNDCRIAASALAAGFVLVTSNAADFGRIEGLQLEDWTR